MAKKAKAAKAKKGPATKAKKGPSAKAGKASKAARKAKAKAPGKVGSAAKGKPAAGRAAKKQPKVAAASAAAPKPAHGTFMWQELLTRDDGAAVAFFERLLGWTCQDWPMGPGVVYRVMKNRGTSLAGIMQMSPEQFPPEVPPHWTAYIAVDDVDARYAQASALGGEGVHPPTDIPGVGRFCIIRDPSGAPICLMTPEGGAG